MADTLTAYKQNTKIYTMTFTNSVGVAIDITDCTIYFTIKSMESSPTVTDTNALLHKIILPAAHTTPSAGITSMTLTNDNLNIDVGTYYFDFQMINASGEITTLQKGVYKILERVTLTTTV